MFHLEGLYTYVSSPKNAMKKTTTALYIEPMPYAHLQLSDAVHELIHDETMVVTYLARAHKNPNKKGETKGETRKPMVQMLSCHGYTV